MNAQADSLIESEQFDAAAIHEKRQSINSRFERVKNLGSHRQSRLNEAYTLHQFFRDIADQESWIKEKKLLVGSADYGRDLTGKIFILSFFLYSDLCHLIPRRPEFEEEAQEIGS